MFFLSDVLRNYLIDGILLIFLGVMLFLWPQGALALTFCFLGYALLLMGTVKILVYLFAESRSSSAVAVGGIQALVGLCFLVKPYFFISFFPMVAALILMYGAVMLFFYSRALRDFDAPFFFVGLLSSLLMLALALLIFFHPAVVANLLMQLTGVSMILEGISLLWVLSKVR